MTDDQRLERAWQARQEITSRQDAKVMAWIAASAEYGRLVLNSALLLNGGALFVLPAYIAQVGPAKVEATPLILSAGSFILGIVLAAICGSAAFCNFQAAAESARVEGEQGRSGIDGLYDSDSDKERRVRLDTGLQKLQEATGQVLTRTLRIGLSTCAASFVAFGTGCIFAAQAML